MKRTVSLFAASLVLAGSLIGCGNSNTNFNSDISNLQVQTSSVGQNSNNNVFPYGLGCKLEGLQPMTEDDSDFRVNAALPENVDLRAGFSPIYNQGQAGACVAFSTVHGLGEFLERKKGNNTSFSARFLWNLGRKTEKTIDSNGGMFLNDAKKIMDNIGMVPESEFPFPSIEQTYNDDIFKPFYSEVPNNDLIKEAKKYRVSQGWVQIKSVHAMRNALAHGMPVVFAIQVYTSIANSPNGIIPMPTRDDKFEGGHAIVAVGYNNAKRQFIIRNSWSTYWGDLGYGYLSYDYIAKGFNFKGQGLGYEGFTAKF